ncbi:unnamed protein product [Peronospora belbahrii]|uniref:Cep57 centrosome microtubule-binding domain-containing protein n=1 Tax=Peronospora belbahrii TaxID=622444 RepID=A0AAU9L4M3_9STRA|nr:unnamed protein product [Peronospora belbahrii]
MKAMSGKGGETSVGNTSPHLTHLESLLQQLTQCEERKRQHGVENAAANTRHKLLSSQLIQTQKELVAAQASKAKMCEEIGALQLTKKHQDKQLDKYKVDLQTAREAKVVMTKKMEQLEALTWTIKQQYIRSLASRIKTSALVLQQLNVVSQTSFSAQVAEKCIEWEQPTSNKRKRILEVNEQHQSSEDRDKPEHTGSLAENTSRFKDTQQSEPVAVDDPATIEPLNDDTAMVECPEPLASASHNDRNCNNQREDRPKREHEVGELRAQVTKFELDYSVLSDKYNALARDYDEILAENTMSAQEIKASKSKIEELTQMLEILRSKPHELTANTCSLSEKDKDAQDGRLKILEENLAQMNGYADQLEMVIAQCPSCTIKLRDESTQDSVANRTE